MVSPRLHDRDKSSIIELTQQNIQELNNEGETLIQGLAIIEIDVMDRAEPSSFYTLAIGITRKTLLNLMYNEVEIDEVTLKLKK